MDRRDILSDPVAAFSKYRSNPAEEEINALYALSQQAQLLQQKHNDIKTSSKVLSGRIGEARRNSEPIEQLVTSMHELSSQLKTVKKDLGDIETQIVNYFDLDNHIGTSDEDYTVELCERSYAPVEFHFSDISITSLGDELDEWNSYVANNAAASIYHRAEWHEIAKKCYGLESHSLVARTGNRIAGILPLVRLKSRLFGDYMVSMPYFMRGGSIAEHPSIEQKLIEAANDHAAKLGIDHIEYRDDIPHQGHPVRTDKVHMVLQLPESEETLWKSFTPKLRSQIRRPQRENPQINFGRIECLDDFYTVYARNMRDLGSPVHSKTFIRNILEFFPENSWIIVLHLNSKPVAAGLLLQHRHNMDIPLASTIRDVNPLGINMLMYWEILRFSIQKRCRQFDFGRSSKGSGTHRFKQQWGATPKQLYLHYWLNKDSEIPSLNPSNPKYAAMINVWQHLPVRLTQWIGPQIVKNLP